MDWQKIDTNKVEEALAAAAPDLETFRALTAGYFKAFAKPPYSRRPNLGLRLPGESCVIAVRPSWSWAQKQLDCDKVLVECITDDKLLSIRLKPGELPRHSQISLRYGDVALGRLLQVVRTFVKDPQRVFSGGQDFCGICGRRLTDAASRTRGIGPESLVKYQYLSRL
jgi:hypothetical protein